mgnify:CR=1 FL=1
MSIDEVTERRGALSPAKQALLGRFVEELKDVAKIDQAPQMEGRRMTTILAPSGAKKA